ncbi:MAG: hypothetical protein ACI9UJ_001777, partial [bacterium]
MYVISSLGCDDRTTPSTDVLINNMDSVGVHDDFELRWRKQTTKPQICRGTFVYEKGVVFFIQEMKSNSRDEILALDKQTGDTLWIWNEGPYFTNHRFILENTLYFTAGTSVFAIDCFTGQTKWQYVPPTNLAYMSLSVSDMGVYVSYQDRRPNPQNNETTLYEISPSGIATEVFRINANDRDGFTFSFDHITPWKHSNGDIILFCESRSWNFGPANKGRADYVSINKDRRQIYHDWGNLFQTIDIGGKSVRIEDEIFISSGWNQIAAIDLANKKSIWLSSIPDQFATSSLLPVHQLNDKIFLSIGNFGHLNIVDTEAGKLIKSVSDLGTDWFATRFINYKDMAWFTTTTGLYSI